MKLALFAFVIGILVLNIYSMKIGKLGTSKLHKIAKFSGMLGVIFFLVFLVIFLDLFSQVWVKRENYTGIQVIVSAIVLFIASVSSLVSVFCLKSKKNES